MPKVYLTEARRDELLRKYVRVQMAELDIKSRGEVAAQIPMSRNTLRERLKNPDAFTRGELRQLFKVLKFSEEQIADVVL